MCNQPQSRGSEGPTALRVVGLNKSYGIRPRPWEKRKYIHAAAEVSFEVPWGRTLGLVGSSGSGKSTVARCVTRLEAPDSGQIWWGNLDVTHFGSRELRPYRSLIQMIFQDPITAMNPRMSAAEIIEEPLFIQNRGTPGERRECSADLMREVGLSPDSLNRRITEFSGGQRQRIAIARSLTLKAKILVLDEALSNLDLSTQSQIVDLLQRLQASHGLSYLLISHDLALVARMAENIAIISGGRIVEQGPTRQVISTPSQPATKELVRAAEELRKKLCRARGASA